MAKNGLFSAIRNMLAPVPPSSAPMRTGPQTAPGVSPEQAALIAQLMGPGVDPRTVPMAGSVAPLQPVRTDVLNPGQPQPLRANPGERVDPRAPDAIPYAPLQEVDRVPVPGQAPATPPADPAAALVQAIAGPTTPQMPPEPALPSDAGAAFGPRSLGTPQAMTAPRQMGGMPTPPAAPAPRMDNRNTALIEAMAPAAPAQRSDNPYGMRPEDGRGGALVEAMTAPVVSQRPMPRPGEQEAVAAPVTAAPGTAPTPRPAPPANAPAVVADAGPVVPDAPPPAAPPPGPGAPRPTPIPSSGPITAPEAIAPPAAGDAQDGRGGFPSMFSRGPGGILPERGSQAQYDLVTSLVQAALQSAPNSGSPLLAALAPMLGGAALSRVEGLRGIGQQREQDALAQSLFGRPMTDSERQLMEVMANEDLPAFYRSEAERQLRAAMGGGQSGGGGGRGGAASPNPTGDSAPTVDEMAVLLGATDGNGLLTEGQRRQLFTMLRDSNATSQERQLAQRLIERHDAAIRRGAQNPEGLPPAPSVATAPPQAPAVALAAPQAPGAANIPPPPPGTVPF